MRKLDLYWKSNRDWWGYDKDFYPMLRKDAPREAWESYSRYLVQIGYSQEEADTIVMRAQAGRAQGEEEGI